MSFVKEDRIKAGLSGPFREVLVTLAIQPRHGPGHVGEAVDVPLKKIRPLPKVYR